MATAYSLSSYIARWLLLWHRAAAGSSAAEGAAVVEVASAVARPGHGVVGGEVDKVAAPGSALSRDPGRVAPRPLVCDIVGGAWHGVL